MKRIPRTPGEAPAREFEPVPPVDRHKRPPRKSPHGMVPPSGAVRREPAGGPVREPELQGH